MARNCPDCSPDAGLSGSRNSRNPSGVRVSSTRSCAISNSSMRIVRCSGAIAPCGTACLELGDRVIELVEDQLEPELVGLMDDHEQHLVMRALGERVLQVEKLVDAQVRAVISAGHHRAALYAHRSCPRTDRRRRNASTPGDQDVVERERFRRRQLIEVARARALSGRQRRNRDAWRKRPLCRWSNDTSQTSSGRTDVYALSADLCQRLGPPGVRP